MVWRSVLLCLLICSIGRAYFHLPTNSNYDFSSCAGSTCRSGQSIGYGCINGNCTYICSDGFCSGYKGYQGVLPPISHELLMRPWGHGAVRRQGGCNGGNCGYWGGCVNEYCGGYYDFRGCPHMDCESGPFHGHGCRNGNCQIVCHGNNCYIESAYGTPISIEPMRPARNGTFMNVYQYPSAEVQLALEDIGETFREADRWMLQELNSSEVFDLVRSWIKDDKVFYNMRSDGEEVKFILNQFRKRNRMQARLKLWREGKKAQLYYDTLCPYKHDEYCECPYTDQCPQMIPYQPCPQPPPEQYPVEPRLPYYSPYYTPQSYYTPGWKPWVQPQVPNNYPGGYPHPKPPMIPPPPVYPQANQWGPPPVYPQSQPWAPSPYIPQAQPWSPPPYNPPSQYWAPPSGYPQSDTWAPPRDPIKCPGGCPWQKPPSTPPPPVGPQAQPWAPSPYYPQSRPWAPPPYNPQSQPWSPPPYNPQPQPWSPPPYNPQPKPWSPPPYNPQSQPWSPPPYNSQSQHWAPPSGYPSAQSPVRQQASNPVNPQARPWSRTSGQQQVNPQAHPWVPPKLPWQKPFQMPPKTPPSTWRKPPMIPPHP